MSSYRLIRRADGWLVCVGQGSMMLFAQRRDALRAIRDAKKLLKPVVIARKQRARRSSQEATVAPAFNAELD